MKKLIIFDFDGTLADTKKIAYPIYVSVATQNGMKVLPEEDIHAMAELPLKERLKIMGVNLFKLPSLLKSTREAVKHHLPEVEMFPGIKEGLEALNKKQVALAIVSSNSKENISLFLQDKDVNADIDIHGGASLFGKATMIKRLLKKRNLNARDCLYVGDESRDIEACLSLGIEVIAVTYGYDTKAHLEASHPDHLASDPEALFALLKSLTS